MVLVYEECGNCRRKGAYVVADRGVVRCKYCTASEEYQRFHPSNLGTVAAGLHAVGDTARGGRRRSSRSPLPPAQGRTRIGGGVMSMDMATIGVLASGANRRRKSYPAAKSFPLVAPCPQPRDLRAVVVDDDPFVRGLVAVILRRGGMTVTQAGSGEDGCAAILADPPDIAVLDLSMPGMDGLEVLVELKRRCDTGIVVLSGRSGEGDRVVARELGADDYVVKPFAPADLMSRVVAVIAGRGAREAASSTG